MIREVIRGVIHRLGLDVISKATLFRKVAKTSWYQGDGATLMLLLTVQVVTGIVLSLSYTNSIDGAFESVRHITHQQTLGWFIRGLHYWSGGLMVVMLVFHVFRQVLIGGYKAPREGTWFSGVLLFFITIAMSFSGYVLRWDERGIYAIKVLLNILSNVPYLGEPLVLFVQGGTELGGLTLSRFFSVHVIIMPFLLLGLVAYHMFLVIHHGTTSKVERKVPVETAEEHEELYDMAKKSKLEGEDFYPFTVAASGLMSFLVLTLAIALTLILGPAELYPEANLTSTSFPKEEWWFSWYSATIALMGPNSAPRFMVWFPVILFFVLAGLPLVDRGANRGMSNRPFWVATVGLATIVLMGLSALRVRSPWTGWPSDELPSYPRRFIVTPEVDSGRKKFVAFGCSSCHAVAGQGPGVGPDITKFERILTREDIRKIILSPPKHVAMPSYAGKVTAEELTHLIEYVFLMQIQPRVP